MTNRLLTILSLCVLTLSSALCLATDEMPTEPTTPEALTERVRAIAEQHDSPAFALSLIENNSVVWQHTEGMADRDKQIEANNDTLFRIGSVSKMFVGLSVLTLVEEGKLDLYGRVRDLAPDIPFQNQWEDSHPVRLIHLLEHTTGWDDMYLREYSTKLDENIALGEALQLFPESRTTRWMPGTRHAYCNSGPAVAAYIVERVTGVPFEQYVQDTFFNPLGMNTATFFKPDNYETQAAKVYMGGKHQPYWTINVRPSGSINASLNEMTHFLQFLVNKGEWEGEQLVGTNVFDTMERTHTQVGVAEGMNKGYGLTTQLEGHKGVPFYGHGGAVMGGMAFVGYNRELGEGFVLLMTGDGVGFFQALEVIKGYLARKSVLPEDWQKEAIAHPLPEKFTQLDGWYREINSRTTRVDMMLHLAGVQKFWHEGNVFHRSPLFAGWVSNDIAYSDNVLTDTWTTKPTVAIAQDPIAGEVVQVGGSVFKKVSALDVFGHLGVAGLTLLMSVLGSLYGLFWMPYRLAKKRMGRASSQVMLAPTLTGFALILFMMLPSLAGMSFDLLAKVSWLSLLIMASSIIYPMFTLWAAVRLVTLRNNGAHRALVYLGRFNVACHLLVVMYLASYGWVFYRPWLT